ncbi:hypothetical protein ACQ1ZZ_14370, partial [Enterococcus faecalis]
VPATGSGARRRGPEDGGKKAGKEEARTEKERTAAAKAKGKEKTEKEEKKKKQMGQENDQQQPEKNIIKARSTNVQIEKIEDVEDVLLKITG